MSEAVKRAPAIYVACLASYNAGRLFGTWIDLTVMNTRSDVMEAIQEMLADSPCAGAEEWDIHDTEHLPSGISSLGEMLEWAEAIEKGADPVALEACYELMGSVHGIGGAYNDFYRGVHESAGDYLESQYHETCPLINELPVEIRTAIDWDHVAKSHQNLHEFAAPKGVHIFEGI